MWAVKVICLAVLITVAASQTGSGVRGSGTAVVVNSGREQDVATTTTTAAPAATVANVVEQLTREATRRAENRTPRPRNNLSSGLRAESERLRRGRNRLSAMMAKRGPPTTPGPTTTTTPGPTTTHMDEGVTTAISKDGIISREPLTRSQVNRAQVAVRKLVNDNRTPAGHHPFNAGILRLSFHDCVGLLGCDGCINHNNRANSGLVFYARQLDKLWRAQFSHSMTQADFWALAGITVAQFSMELNPNCKGEGCVPDIPFFWGRQDCGVPTFFSHLFCPIHDDATQFFNVEFGLNKTEYMALMGAHTLGRVNTFDGHTWDRTPDYFDNDYYKVLIDPHSAWRIANRTSVPELNESWINQDRNLLMLGSDIALISSTVFTNTCRHDDPLDCPDDGTREQVRLMATDNKLFLQQFVNAYQRVINKSPFRLFEVIEDTRYGPRWERPGTLPTWPPTTTTTTTTTTTPAPIIRGTRLHDTDSEFTGAMFCQFDGGVLCPFLEQMSGGGDRLDMLIARPFFGGISAKMGDQIMYQSANRGTNGLKAWIKIKMFKEKTGCLHLYRYQTDKDAGQITAYRALGGIYPGNKLKSVSNVTSDWTFQQFSLQLDTENPQISHELILEFEMGSRGYLAVDDIIFDDRQEC